ncbi:MAG: aryl-sulfate sulfotransferase [Bacteroidetes bacterium]|nr:aryl-sulfate sulfotransferase [Bacteroidota bacterium]
MKAVPLVFFLFLFVQSALPNSNPVLLIPKPDSKYNKTSTSVSIRFSQKIASGYLNEKSVSIIGSKSGEHTFSSRISDDGYTAIFYPDSKFFNDETVFVKVSSGTKNKFTEELSFKFQTEKQTLPSEPLDVLNKEMGIQSIMYSISNNTVNNSSRRTASLPLDFPQITVSNSDAPSPGYIYLSNFSIFGTANTPYLMILENSGKPVFYREMPSNCLDFKKQPDGNMTYYDSRAAKFIEMNSNYEIIDSFYCGNGYSTDLHELRLVDNSNHILLMSYDPQLVDMRNFIAGGDSAAIVTGLVIQELDRARNVIFQWRSWDNFEITDAVYENLYAHQIDYVHGNAIELDNDGNIIISSRHQEELTKINRSNGEIMWRFGGRHNQFTFLNDSIKFSYQHAVRRLANGNISIFDNGNYRFTRDPTGEPNADSDPTFFSRAAEYQLDETRHTAKLVWQYINNRSTYGYAMGYTQRLANGNTIIGWGAANPTVTEVNANREKVFELTLPDGICSYRAYRFGDASVSVQEPLQSVTPSKFSLYQNYPNPFNPSTTIKFDIPALTDVKLSIYNLIGQKVKEVDYEVKSPGSYEYKWNASEFSSGIYFYELKTNTFTQTKQMMLIK